MESAEVTTGQIESARTVTPRGDGTQVMGTRETDPTLPVGSVGSQETHRAQRARVYGVRHHAGRRRGTHIHGSSDACSVRLIRQLFRDCAA